MGAPGGPTLPLRTAHPVSTVAPPAGCGDGQGDEHDNDHNRVHRRSPRWGEASLAGRSDVPVEPPRDTPQGIRDQAPPTSRMPFHLLDQPLVFGLGQPLANHFATFDLHEKPGTLSHLVTPALTRNDAVDEGS